MHWREHNQLNARRAHEREELEQAYWHARTAMNRPGIPASARRKWEDHAERAKESLRQMGVHLGGQ